MFFPHSRFRRRTLCLVLLPLLGIAACTRSADRTSASAHVDAIAADTDSFGAPLPSDASFAARVVSLNPAATEVIFAMGAQASLVGRSKWDEFPAEAKAIMPVGDGIRPNIEAVLRRHPTLVILYATAENRAAADAFAKAGIRTLTLRVDHIAQFMSLTRTLGVALGVTERAAQVVDSVQRTLDAVRTATRGARVRRVVWPLWQQPLLVVGRGSYLDELLEIAGAENVFHDIDAPSPPVNIEEVARREPDAVVTSVKNIPSLESSMQWRAVRAVREKRFVVSDPELTGRPSVVLGMAAVSLARALHPELAATLPPEPGARR